MSRFTQKLRNKSKKKLKNKGFTEIGEQHNGCLFVHLGADDTLSRRVVTMTGRIHSYKPRKATKQDKQRYGLL